MEKKRYIQDAIGETLLITLFLKCKETKHKKPLIKDPKACEIMDKIEYDFSKFDDSVFSLVGVSIRANYFDEQMKNFIKKNENPVVVLVGCGLDTRKERVGEIAKKATIYQLDIPEVMAIREQYLETSDNEINIHASMLEKKWMEEISRKHSNAPVLFIIEGVLMYFEEEQVKSFIRNIGNYFPKSEFYCDTMSKWISKKTEKHDTVKKMKANFKWGIDEDKEMEKWMDNLTMLSSIRMMAFPAWKRTGLKGWIAKFIPKFKNSSRVVHFKFGKA